MRFLHPVVLTPRAKPAESVRTGAKQVTHSEMLRTGPGHSK